MFAPMGSFSSFSVDDAAGNVISVINPASANPDTGAP